MERLDRTCYHCQHYGLCKLRWDLDRVIREHISMLDVDRANSHVASFGTTIAPECVEFSEQPEESLR